MSGLEMALAVLDPVALAAALALWAPAGVVVGAVQDDPAGPAPRVSRPAATRLAVLLAAAGGLVGLQVVAAGVVLGTGAGRLVPDLSWPALAALVTAAAVTATGAVPVLARQLGGRPVTDPGRWARSSASVRSGTPAGVLAVLLAAAAPAAPLPAAGGPTLLPVTLAAAAVLVARRVLHTAALVRAPRPVPGRAVARQGRVPRPRPVEAGRPAAGAVAPASTPRAARPVSVGVPPSPACAWTTSPTPPRPTA